MANLTNSQKKNRNKFVALCVAIVVVLAAIAVVVYNGLTVASFSNADFEAATAMALDKKAGSVPKSALEEVKYVEFGNDGTQLSVYFGYEDFVAQLNDYIAEQEVISAAQTESNEKLEEMRTAAMEEAKAEAEAAGGTFDEEVFNTNFDAEEHDTGVVIPEATVKHPVNIAKMGASASTGTRINANDIKYFTGAEIISLMGAEFDADILASLNASEYSFVACDFENFNAVAELDFSKIEKFSIDMNCLGVDEETLEALRPNGDKVVITQYFDLGGMYYNMGEMTLTDYFAALEEAEAEGTEGEETAEVEGETETEETVETTEETVEEATEVTE